MNTNAYPRELPRELLTVAEAADRLHVSVTTVRRRVNDGQLPAFRLGPTPAHPLRVDAEALEQFLRPARNELDDAA